MIHPLIQRCQLYANIHTYYIIMGDLFKYKYFISNPFLCCNNISTVCFFIFHILITKIELNNVKHFLCLLLVSLLLLYCVDKITMITIMERTLMKYYQNNDVDLEFDEIGLKYAKYVLCSMFYVYWCQFFIRIFLHKLNLIEKREQILTMIQFII